MSAITPDKDGVTARRIAKEETNKSLSVAFDKQKINDELFAKVIAAGLRAGDTQSHFNQADLTWYYSKKIPNHKTRLGYASLYADIKGHKAPDKVVFPDKDGKPQDIGRNFTDDELLAIARGGGAGAPKKA